MNKLMYRFVATTKKKKEIDPFLDTVCPFRASRVKIVLRVPDRWRKIKSLSIALQL